MDYKKQYLKYKLKYIKLKGGVKEFPDVKLKKGISFDKPIKKDSTKRKPTTKSRKPTIRNSINTSQLILRPACVTTSSGRVVCKDKQNQSEDRHFINPNGEVAKKRNHMDTTARQDTLWHHRTNNTTTTAEETGAAEETGVSSEVDTEFPNSRGDLIFGENTDATKILNELDLKLVTKNFSNYVIWLHSSEVDNNIPHTLSIPNKKQVFHRYYAKKDHCGFINIGNFKNDLNHKSSQDINVLKNNQQQIINKSLLKDRLGNSLVNIFGECSNIDLRYAGWDAQPVSQLVSDNQIGNKIYSGDKSVKDNAQFPLDDFLPKGMFTFNKFFSDESIRHNGIEDSEGNIISCFGVLHIDFVLERVEVLKLENLEDVKLPHPIGQNCKFEFTEILKAIIYHNEKNKNTKPIFIHDTSCRLGLGKTDVDLQIATSSNNNEPLRNYFGVAQEYPESNKKY